MIKILGQEELPIVITTIIIAVAMKRKQAGDVCSVMKKPQHASMMVTVTGLIVNFIMKSKVLANQKILGHLDIF